MALLKIIKISEGVWKHWSDKDDFFALTRLYAKMEDNKFLIVEYYGAKRRKYLISEIEVYDIGGTSETFATFDDLQVRLKALNYIGYDANFAGSSTDVTATHFKGDYNIVTNTPTLANGTGQIGDEYRCTVAGIRDFGAGDVEVGVDDILAYDGSVYFLKVDNNQSTDISGKQDTLVSGTNIKTINGSSILGSGNIEISETILQNLGGASRFTLATTNNYPFIGGAINGGALTAGYNFSPAVTNQYANNYLMLTAGSAGSARGYKFTAQGQIAGLRQGLTFFAIIMPYTITSLTSRFGFPHTNTFTANVENLNGGAWFNIINGDLIARTSSGGLSSSGSTIAINNQEWLMLIIEVIANPVGGVGAQSILFKAKKLDGTVVYNETITTTIIYPSNSSYQQLECGIITTKGTSVGNDALLGICHAEFWSNKPIHLTTF